MTHLILAATPAPGHVNPLLLVSRYLVREGHDVTFLTGEAFRTKVLDTGALFAPLGEVADSTGTRITDPERLALEGIAQLNWDLQHFVVDTIPDQWASLQVLVERHSDEGSIVIAENGFYGVLPGLLGAPGARPLAFVGLGVVPLTVTSEDVPPFGTGLEPDASPEGKARNRELNAQIQGAVFGETQAYFEATMAALGATAPVPFIFDAPALSADLFLQLSIEELDPPRSDLPANIRYIGSGAPASLTADEADALPSWWDEVVAAETVVVVTQGTVANGDLSDLIEPTLEALADAPVLVVAALGSDVEVGDVPANARVAAYVPFDELLPLASVLVSNGGFGGTQQALRNGVPLVLAGLTEDKADGNVRTARTGAAINLNTQRAEATAIRAAVDTVLQDPSYRANAERLQAIYAEHHPFRTIKESLQQIVAAAVDD